MFYYIYPQHWALTLTPSVFYPIHLQLPSNSHSLNLFKSKHTSLLLTTISFDDSSYQFELLNHSQIWFKSFRILSYSLILYIWSTSVYNICIQLCHIFLLVDLNVAYSWLEDMGWCYSMSGVACLIHEH